MAQVSSPFVGIAKGKLGEAVYYRQGGKTFLRARNRNPHNPRTAGQLYQRAIMATVQQMYSAGKVIFDHSFQGKKVGAENMRTFLSLNARKLRATLAADVNGNRTGVAALAAVVAPGSNYPAPNTYIISRGSYQQGLFSFNEAMNGFREITQEKDETVSAYAARVGLVPGDIYTIVAVGLSPSYATGSDSDPVGSTTQQSGFAFVRFIVKSDVFTNTNELQTRGQVFEILDGAPGVNLLSLAGSPWAEPIDIITLFSSDSTGFGAIGVIRSRLDEDLRSDSEMVVLKGENTIGIANPYVLDVWARGTEQLGDSELILEGGDGNFQ